MPPKPGSSNKPSLSGLTRDFIKLDEIDGFFFWLAPNHKGAHVTRSVGLDKKGRERHEFVCELFFQDCEIPNLTNPLQVRLVKTSNEARGQFIAGGLYFVLALHRFNVVSDYTQFAGGKGLWKKIAEEAHGVGCYVRVWDKRTHDWVMKDGEIVKYDAENLDDDFIWQDIEKFGIENTTLFVLSK
jgi:hypothetical protein